MDWPAGRMSCLVETMVPEGAGGFLFVLAPLLTRPARPRASVVPELDQRVPRAPHGLLHLVGGIVEGHLGHAVAVHAPTKVWRVDASGRQYGKAMSVADVGHHLPTKCFRPVTWRQGTKGKLCSRFAVCRVLPVRDEATADHEGEVVWLLLEWPPDEPASTSSRARSPLSSCRSPFGSRCRASPRRRPRRSAKWSR